MQRSAKELSALCLPVTKVRKQVHDENIDMEYIVLFTDKENFEDQSGGKSVIIVALLFKQCSPYY